MTNKELQKEVYKIFRYEQNKLIYYVIALAVASIGFSISITIGESLKIIHAFLGLAILSWGISIYLGIRYLRVVLNVLYANFDYLDVIDGKHKLVGKDPQKIGIVKKMILKNISDNSDQGSWMMNWQQGLFFFGVGVFVTWHILEMYSKII